MEWNRTQWNGTERNGMEWNGMEWTGLGLEWNGFDQLSRRFAAQRANQGENFGLHASHNEGDTRAIAKFKTCSQKLLPAAKSKNLVSV